MPGVDTLAGLMEGEVTNPNRKVPHTMESSSPQPRQSAALLGVAASAAIIGTWIYLAVAFGPVVAIGMMAGTAIGSALAGWARRAVLDAVERRRARKPAWLAHARQLPAGQHRPEEVTLRLALVGLAPGVA